jgi:hypothetical protein
VGTIETPTADQFAEAWRANRTYLVGLAFGMLAFAERQLSAILLLTTKAGVITTINVLADPERIGSLGSQLKEVP